MSKELFVGIDISSFDMVCCFLNSNGEILVKPFQLPNNLSGATKLESKIDSVMPTYNLDKLLAGTEATSFYDYHIIDFLQSSPLLSKYSPQIFRFNPKIIKAFKKSYPESDHTDPVTSFVIADRLRFGHLPPPYSTEQKYLPLKRVTRYRFHLTHSLTREKNYFLANLFLKFSAFKQTKIFSNTFGNTSLALLEEFFSVDDIVNTPIEDLVEFLCHHGKNRFSNPEEIVQTLKYAARESYRLKPAVAKSVNFVLATSLDNIRALSKCIKQIDAAIQRELKAFRNPLLTIDGLGPVYSTGILAEIGDINRFSEEYKIAKLAGLAWKKFKSGKFKAEETPMLPCANKYLRYYLVEAANSLRVHNEEYKKYYQKKYQEVPKHKHKRAIVLCARKLVRLVFALLSNNRYYSSNYSANTNSQTSNKEVCCV